jgi:hypothetical protein
MLFHLLVDRFPASVIGTEGFYFILHQIGGTNPAIMIDACINWGNFQLAGSFLLPVIQFVKTGKPSE